MDDTVDMRIDSARLAVQPDALFAYGTLTFPEVLKVVLGRVPACLPVTATGWRVAALRDRPFPVLVRGRETVNGVLVSELTMSDWSLIDAFEAPAYDLVPIALDGADNAWTYVIGGPASDWAVLPEMWDREGFRAGQLDTYLQRCAMWRRRYDEDASQQELITQLGPASVSPR